VSLTFQLSEVHQNSPPKCMLLPTSSRSSPLRGFLRSELSSSSNSLLSIFADSYTILFSSTFITRNATQRVQLWTVADFPTCNPNRPILLIATVTTSGHMQIVQLRRSRPYPSASMPTTQYKNSISNEKEDLLI